ncbi:MAG TPA: DUF3459 domain-containing protein, partial [Geminicoccaceae bacterium]|nr:DUF3459 domain-containing protein [Geminicoccaceae bacterium]
VSGGRGLVGRLREAGRLPCGPVLPVMGGHAGEARRIGGHGLDARWRLGDGRCLRLIANLADAPMQPVDGAQGRLIHRHPQGADGHVLPPWSLAVHLLAEGLDRG